MDIKRDANGFFSFEKNYWKYYRELEKEFLHTQKYVEFNADNWSTYSIEYLKLYQAICSEIDVIGKTMAKVANQSFKPEDKQNNIYKWWYEIQDVFLLTEGPFTYMNSSEVPNRFSLNEYRALLMNEIEVHPWNNFRIEKFINRAGKTGYRMVNGCKMPSWWSDYNRVKHSRIIPIGNGTSSNYNKANLGNVSTSLAALYILEKAYMDAIGTEENLSCFMDFSEIFVCPRRYSYKEMDAIFESINN